MVWAPGQLAAEPVQSRIASSAQWLAVELLNRDILIVGYWTDWDYLNDVLAATLNAVNPSRVIVVDPADGAIFQEKAPVLYEVGARANTAFQHVRVSGADFLDTLRKRFSKTFIRRLLHAGVEEYAQIHGREPTLEITEPPDVDNQSLWQIRRDIEGAGPNQPANQRVPPNEPLLSLTVLQLRNAGAVPEGSYWLYGGRRVRILRAANKLLHRVQAEYERETAPAVAPDIVIAVGAEAHTLPHNIARASTPPSVARGNASRWMTRPEFMAEWGL
jgi:hypothetical protein